MRISLHLGFASASRLHKCRPGHRAAGIQIAVTSRYISLLNNVTANFFSCIRVNVLQSLEDWFDNSMKSSQLPHCHSDYARRLNVFVLNSSPTMVVFISLLERLVLLTWFRHFHCYMALNFNSSYTVLFEVILISTRCILSNLETFPDSIIRYSQTAYTDT